MFRFITIVVKSSVFLCLVFLASSCTEGLTNQELIREVETIPIGLDATITLSGGKILTVKKEPDSSIPQNLSDGRQISNLHAHGYFGIRTNFGPEFNLTLSKREVGNAISEEFHLGLRFWSPVLALSSDGTPPTTDALAAYFTPGRIFPAGQGENFAQLGILIPTEDRSGKNFRSRTDYLFNQEGTITVESVEPFTPTSELVTTPVTYSIITFSFTVSVGVYNPSAGAEPGEFVTDNRAMVVGTASLVL